MLYKIRNKISYYNIDRFIRRQIVNYQAAVDSSSPFILVTQLCKRDLYLYLVSVISFTRRNKPKKIIIINDGSLGQNELLILNSYIPSFEVIEIGDIETGRCPRGGTWERLVLCCKLSAEKFVVQLDADTITIDEMLEVRNAIYQKKAFILGTYRCSSLLNLSEASRFANNIKSQSIQIIAEQQLVNLDSQYPDLYMRGCSGFAGYSGMLSFSLLEEFSTRMQDLLGEKNWKKWGSEQFASNYILANSNPDILAEPKYQNYYQGVDISNSIFVHFIGRDRFKSDILRKTISHTLPKKNYDC